MNTTTRLSRIAAASTALLLLSGAALASPAAAKHGEDDDPSISDDSRNRTSGDDSSSSSIGGSSKADRKIKRGDCSAATNWKLKAKPDDGRIEVEFEVDSNKSGQRWTYKIRHDGNEVASGARTTAGRSGSFSVERRVQDAAGVHKISASAKNARTGETCKASLSI